MPDTAGCRPSSSHWYGSLKESAPETPKGDYSPTAPYRDAPSPVEAFAKTFCSWPTDAKM